MPRDEQSVYDLIGNEAVFQQLVDVFYAKVENDPVLRPLFPDDLEPGKVWQKLFLMQYFGGPTQYMDQRGHPRLRMRHSSFAINTDVAEHWLSHMLSAIDEVNIVEPARGMMRDYFQRVAPFMINHYDLSSTPDEDG